MVKAQAAFCKYVAGTVCDIMEFWGLTDHA